MASSNSTESQRLAVGIDLGTTESVLAYVDDAGAVHTWKSAGGESLQASALRFGDKLFVGDAAIRASHGAGELVTGFKRDMGSSYSQTTVDDINVPAEVLGGFVLQHLAQQAERDLGAIEDVVISVPACFNAKRRMATEQAGRLAGLNTVGIINDPMAAAIGHSYQLGQLRQAAGSNEGYGQNILVYDFGGGTFDATLLQSSGNRFRTLATDGDVRLGGVDIDHCLARFFAEEFYRSARIDPRRLEHGEETLIDLARMVKHSLATQKRHAFEIKIESYTHRMELNRQQFASLVGPLVERTLTICKDVLLASQGLRWSDISTILLLGGCSQIPMIASKLKQLTGIGPTLCSNPQQLVAEGCALYAANLSDAHSLKLEISNVNSHSLGIRSVGIKNKKPINRIIVRRNTTLPVTVKKKFVTYKENQQNLRVILLEGERKNPELCCEFGKFRVCFDDGVEKGRVVEVCIDYNQDGTIKITARTADHDQRGSLHIQEGRQPLESLETWRLRLLAQPSEQPSWDDAASILDEEEIFEHKRSRLNGLLNELDKMFMHIGRQAKTTTLPDSCMMQQRTIIDIENDLQQLVRFDEKLNSELCSCLDPIERKEIQHELSQLRTLEVQKQRALNHAVISLGHQCLAHDLSQFEIAVPARDIRQLQKTIDQIWHGN